MLKEKIESLQVKHKTVIIFVKKKLQSGNQYQWFSGMTTCKTVKEKPIL